MPIPSSYNPLLRSSDEGEQIYDPTRQKYVALTPEEWVRQYFIDYLVRDRGCPLGLIVVERQFNIGSKKYRADLVVHRKDGQAGLIVECKAPEIPISQDTFDQAARYNQNIRADYLAVTNGSMYFCCKIDTLHSSIVFLDEIPVFREW